MKAFAVSSKANNKKKGNLITKAWDSVLKLLQRPSAYEVMVAIGRSELAIRKALFLANSRKKRIQKIETISELVDQLGKTKEGSLEEAHIKSLIDKLTK